MIAGILDKIIRFRSQKGAALVWELGSDVSAYAERRERECNGSGSSVCEFDPETATILGAAYDEALARLLDQPDVVRELVAKRLVALATRGERNIHKLCDEALIAEGFLN